MLSLKLKAVYITIPERSNRGVFWGNCCIFQLRIDITNRKFQIQQYFCLLVHSAVVGTAQDYLKNMLYPVSERTSQRALRSATNNDMVVPRSRLKFGELAFSIAAPRAWNSIPADLRATLNTATFKKNLKTFLFREAYSSF